MRRSTSGRMTRKRKKWGNEDKSRPREVGRPQNNPNGGDPGYQWGEELMQEIEEARNEEKGELLRRHSLCAFHLLMQTKKDAIRCP